MVLSVLLCAGAVPLSVDDQQPPPAPQPAITSIPSAPQTPVPFDGQQGDYVQYLEHLVGELSGVFAAWVHQNPLPTSAESARLLDMYRMANCRQQHPSSGELSFYICVFPRKR